MKTIILAVLLTAVSFLMPAVAKVPPCVSSISLNTCTQAQRSALMMLNDPNHWYIYAPYYVTISFRHDPSTGDILTTVSEEDRALIIRGRTLFYQYVQLIVDGFTPNDQQLQEAEQQLKRLTSEFTDAWGEPFDPEDRQWSFVSFNVEDVFPSNNHTSDLNNVMFQGDREYALQSIKPVFDSCDLPICPQDRVAILLGSKPDDDKGKLYTDKGFRTTGGNGYHWTSETTRELVFADPSAKSNYDYNSFGVWAKDSFWGFWQADPSPLIGIDASSVFIAGGRNKSKPNPITGTWSGLAVGKHKLIDEVRVGRSKVTVYLGPKENKVDVTITGLSFGSHLVDMGENQYLAGALFWKGLNLTSDGSFRDHRMFGVIDSLDDTFAAIVPPSGENYSDTAYTITGQFYGSNGDEVTGVFDKNNIEGSFGAYRGD